MSQRDLRREIQMWAKKVGRKRARVELVTAGLGLSTVGKLIAGKYESDPVGIAEILEKVLAETAAAS